LTEASAQADEKVRITAKTAGEITFGVSSVFPEFPRLLPSIPQRYSQHLFPEDFPGADAIA
jgi:hypothetical protein